MPSRLARKTLAEIEKALSEERTTAITEIIQLIQQLAAKAFSISISELSLMIGRDPTITEKVISAANTLGYNPSGVPISTISEALHTVGFEKIRNLAISLMLAENSGEGRNTYEQRNTAALCVCSGMLAEELHRLPDENEEGSEVVFVSASLRNYGRILLSTFLVDNYRLARSHALDMREDEAFKHVFGLTPIEVGRHILQQTNLPKGILQSLSPLEDAHLKRPATRLEDQILVLSELSGRVCSIVFDEQVSPQDFSQSLEQTLSVFSGAYPISPELVNEALITVEQKLTTLNRAVGLSDSLSPGSVNLQARLNGDPLPEPPPFARISAQLKQKSVSEMTESERATFSNATFAQAVESIEACLVPGAKFKLEQVFSSVSTAFREAADLENCLIFVREEFDDHCLSARYGNGDLYSKVKNRPILAPEKKDIFSICLARKEDVLIEDTNVGKIRSIIPDWIHSAGETSSFIILPVTYKHELKSIIVGTVSHGRKIDLKQEDLRHLRSIRSMISELYGMIESQNVTGK
ncbi:HDOD domain-containing protein [Pelagicoccus albus]|uniref:HDOD domain-containing protein n=1 Tax=Pelagicoccus albus TaxID=415222 RepID=A0A7X1B742_9BACT|nr:HDOD domain-containing protein [Pelagicoccus albus]MBC2606881.1 HDOD domain-containing protein [Pelagicoccus albus]